MNPSSSSGQDHARRRRSQAARRLGQRGEEAAALLLQREGYVILARNWRCREGELDIIARRGRVIVFCEVKTRSGAGWGTAAAAVTAVKLRRLRVLACRWLAESGMSADSLRFDVITVGVGGDGDLVAEWIRQVSA